ncbi:apolipoprotein A-I [Heteronotia binoei]|uniref:apolipoprotein A-I n=1 Tax=Heteronotia binoei TaxID=13085 RepID=UPI00292D078D|nr:apolipoprotein A-I [Heteronotia binoei]
MKGIGVTLLFLCLAGAQARHFWQQDAPPPSRMEHITQQLQNYLESAKASAREMIAELDASNFGQRFELDLATKVELAAAAAEQVREQISPGYQAVKKLMQSDYEELEAQLAPIRAKVMPLFDELSTSLQGVGQAYYEKVTPMVQEWRQSARQDLEQLRSKMEPLTAQAGEKVRGLMADFRQRAAPHMEEMRQALRLQVQQVQERAVPRLQELRTILQQHMANMQESLAPVVEGIRQKIVPAVKDLEERFVSLLDTVKKNLEQHTQEQQQQS